MNHRQLKEYNESQCEEIRSFKWTESEKAGQDIYPGKKGMNKAAFDWITLYAASYREYWTESHPVEDSKE